MNINEIVLSIVKRPSFNLLAFQAFTFAVMTIAGAIGAFQFAPFGAFQFAPFFGQKGVSMYYFYALHFATIGTLVYTLAIFITGFAIKKIDKILFSKPLTILNCFLYYIIFSTFISIAHIPPSTVSERGTFWLTLVFVLGCIILSIVLCSIIPFVITLIIEQIRKIRINPPQYCKTPIRFWAVVIPSTVYICIIIYIFFELFT